MSLAVGIPYPGSAIVLDLSDFGPLFQGTGINNLFLRIEDEGANNGRLGYLNSLVIEDQPLELCVSSLNVPVTIHDNTLASEEVIELDYSFSQPQNLLVVVDSLLGQAQLSWDTPSQPTGLSGYRIYLNGRVIGTTNSQSFDHFLALRGTQYYAVAAEYGADESLAAMLGISWIGQQAYGIPFNDNFENGFAQWYQAGTSGIPVALVHTPIYEGQYAAGLKTYPSDHTALVRPFDTNEGADVESWFLLEEYPETEGAGGIVSLAQDGLLFGTIFDSVGHPGYFYTNPSYQQIPVLFDTSITVNLNEWYKQKIWYCDGKLQLMLLDSNYSVILNRIANLDDQTINQVALFALGLPGGWNFFDDFSISPWNYSQLQYFNPVLPTNHPYAMLINEATVDSVMLQPGDEIAIFDGTICVGAATVDGAWPLELNVWEADSTGPGFIAGNVINARIWRQQANLEYLTEIVFETGDGTFGNGIYSRFNLTGTQIVAINEPDNTVPEKFSILSAYPNPFNPETVIEISLPSYSKVEMKVYNILGQLVEVVADNHFGKGDYKLRFNGKNLPSGFYLIHTNIEGKIEKVNKVLLIK
jgi:hypothetical protein